MSPRPAGALILCGLLLSTSACSTLNATPHIDQDSPQYFVGTRLNLAAIQNDQATLYEFAHNSMLPADYPLLDLPLSLVMDTVWFGATFGFFEHP